MDNKEKEHQLEILLRLKKTQFRAGIIIIALIAWGVLLYLMFSFANLSINPVTWRIEVRTFYLLVYCLSAFIVALWSDDLAKYVIKD